MGVGAGGHTVVGGILGTLDMTYTAASRSLTTPSLTPMLYLLRCKGCHERMPGLRCPPAGVQVGVVVVSPVVHLVWPTVVVDLNLTSL